MRKVTAREFLGQLDANLDFVAAREAREAKRRERVAESRRAEQPLLEELRVAGYAADTVWDLVNSAASYEDLIPILIRHLGLIYPDTVREGIARALAIPEAKSVWNELLRLYRAEGPGRTKEGIAVAIAAAADRDVIADVVDLVRDPTQGPSRVLLLRALKRSRDPAAWTTITDMATDVDLRKEIAAFLRKSSRAPAQT